MFCNQIHVYNPFPTHYLYPTIRLRIMDFNSRTRKKIQALENKCNMRLLKIPYEECKSNAYVKN